MLTWYADIGTKLNSKTVHIFSQTWRVSQPVYIVVVMPQFIPLINIRDRLTQAQGFIYHVCIIVHS